MQELEEKLTKQAEREKDLYESNARLESHIADLESRKRAPLYQKRQEEELRAAIEKAQEAEIRAQEAELKFKEAKALPLPLTQISKSHVASIFAVFLVQRAAFSFSYLLYRYLLDNWKPACQ